MALYYLYKLVDVAPSVKGAHGDYVSDIAGDHRRATEVDLIVSSNGQIVKDRQGFLYGQENFKSEELRNL